MTYQNGHDAQRREHIDAAIESIRRQDVIDVLQAAIGAAHEEQRQVLALGREGEPMTLFQHWSATAGWLAARIRAVERTGEPDWPDAMTFEHPLAPTMPPCSDSNGNRE